MFIGGRNSYKNYDLLLEAFSRLKNEYSEWKIIVVGENKNTYQSEKIKYDLLGIAHLVEDYGLVSEKKLISLLQRASALIIPSLNEGFNFPLLEALAAGCPVLSSNIPVSKEIGKDYVKYFSNNSDSLVDAMRLNILNPINKAKIISAQKYSRTFNWDKSFNNLERIYESCI